MDRLIEAVSAAWVVFIGAVVAALIWAGLSLLTASPASAQSLTDQLAEARSEVRSIVKDSLSLNAGLAAMGAMEFDSRPGLQLGLGVGIESEAGEYGAAVGVAAPLGRVLLTGKAAYVSGDEFIAGAGAVFRF